MSVSSAGSGDVSSQSGCICPANEERKDFDTLPLIFTHLQRIVDNNLDYFSKYTHKSVYRRFHEAFERIHEALEPVEEMAIYVAQRVASFDFSPQAKGNGYRTLLRLLQHCIRALTDLTYYCQGHRDRFYFRSHHYCLEIEAYTDLFTRMKELLNYAITCMNESKHGELFPDSIDSRIMTEAELMDRECFYGRTLGFQYRSGLRQFLLTVCIAMASFAEGYHRHKASPFACATTSLLHSGKYTVNPELRAKMIVKLTQKTNMEFCKAFWSLTEGFGLQHFPLVVCPALKVNTLFHIPAEPIEITTELGEIIHVQPPCSWSGLAPVQVRLLSYEWREGQIRDGMSHQNSSKVKPKSKGLILHIHGGGFVSQSSKSHEMYLRVWARELNVPIISVDYSLAPEAPFPRAFEECFFTYAWAVMNPDKLGTTAEYLCIAGDSAGGNLSVAVCMQAAKYGIRRPDSLLTVYSPFNVQYIPSPSRLLSLMDPLLPTGILSACLGAYAGLGKSPFEECTKTSGTLVRKETSASLPVDINKRRSNSFLGMFKTGRKSPRSCDTSPSRELGPSPSFDTFHSCPNSPVNSNTSLKNNVLVNNAVCSSSEPYVIHGVEQGPGAGSESYDSHQHHQHQHHNQQKGSGTTLNEGSPLEFHSFKEDHEFDNATNKSSSLANDYPRKNNCIDGHHCNNIHMESNRLLKLNLEDHKEMYIAQKIYDPLGDEYGHTEMQYTRTDDQCHVVNVVDPDQSPCGETMILPVKDPYLPVGTPPLKEVEEALEVSESGKGRSMSQVPLPIAKNPYMSPLVAPDEMLATLPPTDIVACSLDPLLDDSIEFGRRLRSLGKEVEVYILEDLPHGFLNFNLICQEAKEGCDLCIACIKRTLMGKRTPNRTDKAPVY